MTEAPHKDLAKPTDKDLRWIGGEIIRARRNGFFGKMTMVFQDGRLVRMVKEETFLPPK